MVVTPYSQPILQWTAKEKSKISPVRYLKIFLIPALVFPFFAGFNPATYTESDVMPLVKHLVSLIYLMFESTIVVESKILFFLTFYFTAFIGSYFFLVVIFIPIFFFISIISDKSNCFVIYQEDIAKGVFKNGIQKYDTFLSWDKIHGYSCSNKNEFRLSDKKNRALMFIYFEKNDEAKISHYLNYYTKDAR